MESGIARNVYKESLLNGIGADGDVVEANVRVGEDVFEEVMLVVE